MVWPMARNPRVEFFGAFSHGGEKRVGLNISNVLLCPYRGVEQDLNLLKDGVVNRSYKRTIFRVVHLTKSHSFPSRKWLIFRRTICETRVSFEGVELVPN